MRNRPNRGSGNGVRLASSSAIASTVRVSAGSMIPSSHSRAVEWYGLPWCSYCSRMGARKACSAASVLATVKRDQLAVKGEEWSDAAEQAFRAPIREQYEHQGSPYHSTARLWDDGIIDPADTRTVLAMALELASRTPLPEPRFGLFRM